MDPFTLIFAISSILGLGANLIGQSKTAEANEKASAESKKLESIRRQEAKLDDQRRRREIIRRSQIARSNALTAAAGQGVLSSSGAAGAIGQATNQGATQFNEQNQAYQLGGQAFSANAGIAAAGAEGAAGQAISGFGQTLFNNARQIAQVGTAAVTGEAIKQ